MEGSASAAAAMPNCSTGVKTLVLGVGSPLMGDDALGIMVVERLRACAELPSHVTVVDGGTDGVGLIPLIAQYQRVVCVDAVMMDEVPGTIRRLTWGEFQVTGHGGMLSLHQSDLGGALQLAEALNCLPEELVIYGVQPQNTAWDQPISAAVEMALPAVVNAVLRDVTGNTCPDD